MALNTTPASEDADAYENCIGFTKYAEDNGYDLSAYEQADKEQALRRATRWLDAVYGSRFIGSPTKATQALEWPRTGAIYRGSAIDPMAIPVKLKQAMYEAGWREIESPNSLSPDFVATQRALREKVGELEVQYADNVKFSAADNVPTLPIVDGLLEGLLKPKRSGGAVQIGITERQ